MQELRYLFALMVGSQKKYVDPSKAVEILKEAFSSSASTGVGDSQQVLYYFSVTLHALTIHHYYLDRKFLTCCICK